MSVHFLKAGDISICTLLRRKEHQCDLHRSEECFFIHCYTLSTHLCLYLMHLNSTNVQT